MKNYHLFFALLVTVLCSRAQENYPLENKKLQTISGIIAEAYEAISGEAGTLRQLDRIKSLYAPNGIVSKNSSIDGKEDREDLTLKQFHERFPLQREQAFYEEEINREVRIFGNIASVWSTYQIKNSKEGPVVRRGINSFQLHYKDGRWWILSWSWDPERSENRIPASFDRY